MTTTALIQRYFNAFNSGNMQAMLDCLSENVAHHVNEGTIRHGREKFAEFCAHMSDCYQENLTDMVIMVSDNGARAAAEYTVNGTYLKTDAGLPDAQGQGYRLPAGSFFSIANGKIIRVVTYYNLADWVRQVS